MMQLNFMSKQSTVCLLQDSTSEKVKRKKRENRISEMETGFSSFNLFLLLKGDLVVSLLRGRSYHSAMGYNVFMDYNGDAEGNYTLIYKRELPTGKLDEQGDYRKEDKFKRFSLKNVLEKLNLFLIT